jgi:hypothetical protein
VKLYAPEEFAVVVALDAPLNVTVAPLPPVPVIVPEIEYVVVTAVAVNAGTVTLAPLTVALWLAGLKV